MVARDFLVIAEASEAVGMAADQQLVGDLEPCSGGVAGHDLNARGSGHLGELYPLREFRVVAILGLQLAARPR